MLDTIRAYAAEKLAERGEADAIAARHSAWFLQLAQRIAPELSGADQRRLLDQLELEHDNIRAVLDRATASGDAATAIGVAHAVWRFWQKRGHLYEARRRLDTMAAAPWSRDDPALRARLMEALGGVCWWQADIRAMRVAYREAVELWREIGDKRELANALYNYTFVFSVPEDPNAPPEDLDPDGEGQRASDEAYALYEELGDQRGQGNVLWGRGNKSYFSEGRDAGLRDFLAALEKFRLVGDRTMEAWSLHMVGGGLLRENQPEEARPLLREALQHFVIAGDAAGMTMVIDDLSSMALADEEPERASKLWGAGRALAKATGATLASYTDGWIETQLRPNVRNSIEPADLQRWAAEGAAMSLDEAVAYALGITAEELETLRNSRID